MPSVFPRHGIWRTWTTADGLAGLQVLDVVQDPEGYLWIATVPCGLSRFDGEEFRTFTRADGLPGDQVYALLIDRQGRLWVDTADGGLCWYEGGTFQRPRGAAARGGSYLFEDDQGRMWFSGGRNWGYCQDGRAYDLFGPFIQGGPPPPVLACWGMAQDARGDVWFSATGLVRYDGERFHWLASTGEFPEPFLGNNALGSDGHGGLWVGNAQHLFHYAGERFERVDDVEIPIQVRRICRDRQERTWFCLEGGGAICHDGQQFYRITPEDGLAHGIVTHLYQDREGLLWFATWGGGLSCYDPVSLRRCGAAAALPAREVRALSRDPQGRVWLGCGSEPEMWVAELDEAAPLLAGHWDGARLHPVAVPPELKAGPCLAMATDAQGRVWLGGVGGAGWYEDGVFHLEHRLPKSVVTALYASPQGPVYLAWTDIRGQTTRLGRGAGAELEVLYEQSGAQWIRAIRQTLAGTLWLALGTYGGQGQGTGIGRLTERGLQWLTTADGLADNRTEDLLEDAQGRLWVATWGGLSRWDGEQFHSWTTADGLPHNHVRCLHQDARGHLWLGTDAGVCHWDGQTFQTLRSPHLLGVNQILAAEGQSLWLATLHGLVQYTPGQVAPRVRLLPVLADRTYPADGAVEVPVSSGQVILEYQGMSFRTPLAGLRYTWRLQGIESEWQPATSTRRAVYPGLAAGSYTFEVRAIDQDLHYSEPAAVRLSMVPDPQLELWKGAARRGGPAGPLIGDSPALCLACEQLAKAAPGDLTVLLLGETGTGKELAAHLVHQLSKRADQDLVPVNCATIQPGLAESEFFGHEKGAFTGATARRMGWVELAQGGTLFLDEVAELSLEVQAKLLRLLAEGTYQRVGSPKTRHADVRVIAATNRDLKQMVDQGRFREDLYSRLAWFQVELPPLRARREDIPALAAYFLHPGATSKGLPTPRLSPAALAALQAYPWPRNVRELQQLMARALLECGGEEIQPAHLIFDPPNTPAPVEPDWPTRDEQERRYILRVLDKTGGAVRGPQGAAALLGLPESTLRDRIRKLGITRP